MLIDIKKKSDTLTVDDLIAFLQEVRKKHGCVFVDVIDQESVESGIAIDYGEITVKYGDTYLQLQ